MKKVFSRLVFIVSFSVPFAQAVTLDTDREKLIATELARDLTHGELVWLDTAAGRPFPAILYETFIRGHYDTGVIILHGLGGHPDWPDVIGPLRRGLPMAGWPSLSIQLPLLTPESHVSQYGETLGRAKERIHAAVRYLSERGFRNIVLLGYGFGAATGAYYLATEEHHQVRAFIGVSMTARKFLSPDLDLNAQLRKIDIPLLDVYGSRDIKSVTSAVGDRRLAVKSADNQASQQLELPEADHYYTGQSEVLVEAISHWLRSVEPVSQSENEESN